MQRAELLIAARRSGDPAILLTAAGALPSDASGFDSLRARARAEGRSAAVVELTALESLVRAETSPADAEELPECAFLAHVTLARVRRLAGRPHLATHILTTLARYAPAPWRPWIAWELALSFGRAGAGLVGGASDPITRAVDAAIHGTREEAPQLFGRDLTILAALRDRAIETDDPDVRASRSGTAHAVPRGLHGLAALDGGGAIAWVVVDGRSAAERVLSPGVEALVRRGLTRLPQSHRHRGRADTLLAACALAGDDGIDEADLFAASYGFAFVPELHGGPLGVTVHRARQRLGEHATLERGAGRVRLTAPSPMLLPDPRCAVGTEDRALQHIALGGTASARAIADTHARRVGPQRPASAGGAGRRGPVRPRARGQRGALSRRGRHVPRAHAGAEEPARLGLVWRRWGR